MSFLISFLNTFNSITLTSSFHNIFFVKKTLNKTLWNVQKKLWKTLNFIIDFY